ncbi:MAG TPA: hypothetical protein VNQ78_07605 [Paracoccus sp. (in: a-proteobacteria)]|uniref:hypothetical protein n=1 Tax=Paracoccus sp. TaxID=267 RepID=UPI002C7DA1BC|nr:hypothetical protein [Paracoccus sp. (in: a-proteobacteria)]HWL56528.1 hypothetical protein [Paracoccus sp. (in: a-proteobacteria)]
MQNPENPQGDSRIDALISELEAMISPVPERVPKGTGVSFQDPDPSDPDTIMDEVRLTRYDKASRKLRELEAKRAALPADPDANKVAILNLQIENARKAVAAAQDDVARRRDEIDAWRADAGREEYNAGRRKVRDKPNADLSKLRPEQIKQRKLDQTADKKWLDRRRALGAPEAQIQAEFVVRVREREAKRAAAAQDAIEQAEMEALPNYGKF